MEMIELLAPAGNFECVCAAVQNGANAIYVGGSKFSARAYASNFNEEDMIKVVNYCHVYDVKLYVTLNTLLKEDEIGEALEYVGFLYEIGVDALIIQDTGLLYLIRKYYEDFEIHASTQLTIHNGEGALFFKEAGFKRIVLSRELSLEEIKHISKELKIETEIFVHGALCVCYSGQCLMSSMIGGRSGNRGRCAQPCRLGYTIINKVNGEKAKAYLLSPKDICTIEDIEDILESGTSSLKIEGRMKRAEYVAGVTSEYRNEIERVISGGRSENLEGKKKKLLKLFNREGFSKAYFYGNVGKSMMAYSCPRNTGTYIGTVGKDGGIILEDDISLKDGIRHDDDGFTVSKIIKEGKEVSSAAKGDKVKLFPANYKQGNKLFRTSDSRLLEELSKSYEDIYTKKIDLDLQISFILGEKIEISTCYDDKMFKASGDVVSEALKKPLDKERIEASLRKTGNSPYTFNEISFNDYQEGFLPISSINFVRRELISQVQAYVENKFKRKPRHIGNIKLTKSQKESKNGEKTKKYVVVVNTTEQLKAALDLEVENLAINPFIRNEDFHIANIPCEKLFVKVPNILKEEFEKVCQYIEDNIKYFKGIITANVGIINRFKHRLPIVADYKLNVFNSFAAEFYNETVDEICLSVELNKKEIKDMVLRSNADFQFFIYGRPELMISEYCPIGSVLGGKSDKKSCNAKCNEGKFVLQDRMGEEFLITTDKFCRSYIYNNSPINLIPNVKEIKDMCINNFRLDFIDENYEETYKIIESFKGNTCEQVMGKYTRGHFRRGVE